MLQVIHDKIHGIIAGAVIFLVALTFVLWGVQNFRGSGNSHMAAKVNGIEITQEQLHLAYEREKRSMQLFYGTNINFDQNVQAKLKQEVLEHLIDDQIFMQAVSKMGLGVNKELMWAVIFGMPIFQVNGSFSRQAYQQVITGLYRTEYDFFSDMSTRLLRMQLNKGIADTNFVLPMEVELVKKISKQRRDYSYLLISAENFADKIKVTPEEIKQYYEEHKKEFVVPEKISIQYLELDSSKLSSKLVPTNEELRNFYQININAFSTPKRWRVLRVVMPLDPTADVKVTAAAKLKLEEIAKEATKQGNFAKATDKLVSSTSWLTRTDINSEIAGYLESSDVGQLTPVFRIRNGFSFMKVIEVRPAHTKPYSEVAAEIKKGYIRERASKEFSEASEKLLDLAYVNPDSLEIAAKELGLEIYSTELVTRDGAKTGILSDSKVIKAAFSDPVLKQHYNSGLIEITPGRVVVLRIKEHIPQGLRPVEELQEVIRTKLQDKAGKEEASKLATSILDELRAGKISAEQLVLKHRLVWHTVHGASYTQLGADGDLVSASFALPKPTDAAPSLTMVDMKKTYAILRLDKVYDIEEQNLDSKSRERLENTIKALPKLMGQLDYQILLAKFMRAAKIEIFAKTDKV